MSGDNADILQFGDYIQKNIHFYSFKNRIKLNT